MDALDAHEVSKLETWGRNFTSQSWIQGLLCSCLLDADAPLAGRPLTSGLAKPMISGPESAPGPGGKQHQVLLCFCCSESDSD
jgi:hypothetical protein